MGTLPIIYFVLRYVPFLEGPLRSTLWVPDSHRLRRESRYWPYRRVVLDSIAPLVGPPCGLSCLRGVSALPNGVSTESPDRPPGEIASQSIDQPRLDPVYQTERQQNSSLFFT